MKQVPKKNTERNFDSSNDGVYSVMLREHYAYDLIKGIENDNGFGPVDSRGTLEPCPGATQWNWKQKGLFVTCFYKSPRWRGMADILIISTTSEATRLVRRLVG